MKINMWEVRNLNSEYVYMDVCEALDEIRGCEEGDWPDLKPEDLEREDVQEALDVSIKNIIELEWSGYEYDYQEIKRVMEINLKSFLIKLWKNKMEEEGYEVFINE